MFKDKNIKYFSKLNKKIGINLRNELLDLYDLKKIFIGHLTSLNLNIPFCININSIINKDKLIEDLKFLNIDNYDKIEINTLNYNDIKLKYDTYLDILEKVKLLE